MQVGCRVGRVNGYHDCSDGGCVEVRGSTLKVIEKRFRDYPNYENEITKRKAELMFKERDINAFFKAKGLNSNQIESQFIKYESDQYIINRRMWIKAIDETLASLDALQRQYVKDYYFEDVYDYRSLAKKHHTSKDVIWRACRRACNILAEKLGE